MDFALELYAGGPSAQEVRGLAEFEGEQKSGKKGDKPTIDESEGMLLNHGT